MTERIVFWSTLFLVTSATRLQASSNLWDGIDIFSESYSASCQYEGLGSWSDSGSDPVTGSVGEVRAAAGFDGVHAGIREWNGIDTWLAGAGAVIDFRPRGTSLHVDSYMGAWFTNCGYRVTLSDLDSPDVLFDIDSYDYMEYRVVQTFTVDPLHVYRLQMYAGAGTDYSNAAAYLDEFHCTNIVPAPGPLCLAGIGVGLVRWARRRRLAA
jgi:hypothetical protein